MQDPCQLSLVLLTVMGDVRMWRVEHGEWETGRSGRGTCGTSVKDRGGQQGRLSPSCYLSGIPFGCTLWKLVASELKNMFPVVSISGLCESKKDGEGLER